MNALARYVFLVFGILLGFHFILTISHEEYRNATSLSTFQDKWKSTAGNYKRPEVPNSNYNSTASDRKANAAFVILARNRDLQGVLESIKQQEDRFNKKFGYPYVFLNEEVFNEEFKRLTTGVVSTKTYYGLIPRNHWYQPASIDEERAKAARQKMEEDDVIYGGSVPYRNMCRYNSGFFFRHKLLQQFDYYWRIEPNVQFYCDLHYDPFLYMQDHKKVYGFTLSLPEYVSTIETLWQTTKEFIHKYPQYLPKGNAMGFLSDDKGETYNRCHYWSNFEIGDLRFWRGEAYMKYFEYLDAAGGFYYERWGDAPVHSIGVSLFARKDQIHFFNDIGYRHEPFTHCPTSDVYVKGKCSCNQIESFDYHPYSCLRQFERA